MNIVVSGGGTAGHINPALALAEELIARGHTVYFAGTPTGIEARLAREADLSFEAFEAKGFNRRHPMTLIKALKLAQSSTRKAQAWFGRIHPDAVVCFGGYVCIPVGRAAIKGHIPLIVHEQNSVMGLANNYLSKHAQALALTYPLPAEQMRAHAQVVGNPVRKKFFETTRERGRAYIGARDDELVLSVFGGSLGAQQLNRAIIALQDELMARPNVFVYLITGKRDFDEMRSLVNVAQTDARRFRVIDYEDHMADVLKASDLTISRAGATSLAEISALGLPALVVPYPYATADHQTKNASSLHEAGCVALIKDDEVPTEAFRHELIALLDNPHQRHAMHEAMRNFGHVDAAQKLADVVVNAAQASVTD